MSIICFWNRIGSFRILKEIKVSPPCFFNLTSNIMQMGLICIGHWRFLRILGNCRLNFLEYFLISHAMQMPSSLIIDSDVLVWCTSKVLKYIFVLEKLSLKRSAEGQKYQTKISSVRHSFFIYLENIASFKTQKSLSCEKNNWEQLSPCLWQRKIWFYTFTPLCELYFKRKYCALDKYSKKGCFKFTDWFLALAHTKLLVLLTLLLK